MSNSSDSSSYPQYVNPYDVLLVSPFNPQPAPEDGQQVPTGLEMENESNNGGADGSKKTNGPFGNLQQTTLANNTVDDAASMKSVLSKNFGSTENQPENDTPSPASSSKATRDDEAIDAEAPNTETSPDEITDTGMSNAITPGSLGDSILDDGMADKPTLRAPTSGQRRGKKRKCPCSKCRGHSKPKSESTVHAHILAEKIEERNMLEQPWGQCKRCKKTDGRKCYQWAEKSNSCSECTRYKESCHWE
ncbi:hypothetical protein BDP55DRAFT_728600 [Colletotrichum godetiae]|uniref:Uncharacterized protein n=1 Tax=Colletotrichum godetiae TaxID=1209918 RepID=A0AAJ0AKW7_9PEZI|nr:uncharacterized protein BDP55DRAFT_728600 [Colletotrichum godetiae]KAK1675783.1 hypothetical protein BDP55DRAFT_728600 [Colletotrichum godetiae]